MTDELLQIFPRERDGVLTHRRWSVDLARAGRIPPWHDQAGRLRAEVAEMARHFPRWILTVSVGRDLVRCPRCGGMLVFDRGLRCVLCEGSPGTRTLPGAVQLAWFGLMPPVGIDGLTAIRDRLIARPPRQHVVGHRDEIGHYLLVPLVALYPQGFPEVPVRVAHLPGFFTIPGVPREGPSHVVHMLGGGFMCLFAPGDWRQAMTCREVLQQRAYAHLVKQLNYAAGKKTAFDVVS